MAWVTGKRGAFRAQWREGGKVVSGPVRRDRGEAEADKRAREAEEAEHRHRKRPHAGMPLETLLALWKESRTADKRIRGGWAAEVEKTVKTMAEDQGWKTVGDVTRASYDDWKNGKGGVGVNRPLSMLKAVLRYARAVHSLPVPEAVLEAEPVKRPKRQQPPLLTDDQVSAILARAALFGPSVYALCEHLSLYGPRPVDCCKIIIGDWDAPNLRMRYRDTKNGTTQYRAVHAGHGERLSALCLKPDSQDRRGDDEPLFLKPNGTPWEIDWKGSATQLSSWYRNNIGSHLEIAVKDGAEVGWLLPSQTGIYILKDYGLSRAELLVGRRRAMAFGQHKTESAFLRYQATNETVQREALALIPEPKPVVIPGLESNGRLTYP